MASTKLPRFLLCLVLFVSASLTVYLFFAPHFSTNQQSSASRNPPVVFIIGGNVNGAYVFENGVEMTVLKALARAKGVNPDVALDEARLLRRTYGATSTIPLPLKDMLAGKAPDVPLQADDVIIIPRKRTYYDLPLYHDAPAPLQVLQDP
jgi:hypothetical protein